MAASDDRIEALAGAIRDASSAHVASHQQVATALRDLVDGSEEVRVELKDLRADVAHLRHEQADHIAAEHPVLAAYVLAVETEAKERAVSRARVLVDAESLDALQEVARKAAGQAAALAALEAEKRAKEDTQKRADARLKLYVAALGTLAVILWAIGQAIVAAWGVTP